MDVCAFFDSVTLPQNREKHECPFSVSNSENDKNFVLIRFEVNIFSRLS
jgi:hypothetical protein